jgi:hypothetical protein
MQRIRDDALWMPFLIFLMIFITWLIILALEHWGICKQ